VLATAAELHASNLRTPKDMADQVLPQRDLAFAADLETHDRFDPRDRVRRLEAMIGNEVSAAASASLEQAAGRVEARMLIVGALQGPMPNPFAPLGGAEALVLHDECGQLARDRQETGRPNAAVGYFLLGNGAHAAVR